MSVINVIIIIILYVICGRGWAATEFQKSDKSSTDVTRPGGGGSLYTHYYYIIITS